MVKWYLRIVTTFDNNHRIRNKLLRLIARWKEINKRRLELPESSFSGYTDGPLLKLLASLPCYAGFLRWRVKSYQNQFHPILQIYCLALWFPHHTPLPVFSAAPPSVVCMLYFSHYDVICVGIDGRIKKRFGRVWIRLFEAQCGEMYKVSVTCAKRKRSDACSPTFLVPAVL